MYKISACAQAYSDPVPLSVYHLWLVAMLLPMHVVFFMTCLSTMVLSSRLLAPQEHGDELDQASLLQHSVASEDLTVLQAEKPHWGKEADWEAELMHEPDNALLKTTLTDPGVKPNKNVVGKEPSSEQISQRKAEYDQIRQIDRDFLEDGDGKNDLFKYSVSQHA